MAPLPVPKRWRVVRQARRPRLGYSVEGRGRVALNRAVSQAITGLVPGDKVVIEVVEPEEAV